MRRRRGLYLSNHAHVLVCLSRDPEIRLRDVAQLVGLTERGVSRILSELEETGIIEKERIGRRKPLHPSSRYAAPPPTGEARDCC